MAFISLKNAGLQYPVIDGSGKSLRAILSNALLGNKNANIKAVFVEALSDISLELCDGDRLGLIGRNGAGKSTLLKLMAGIYMPTWGEVRYEGNTVTLFDLNYGMDDEANGIENIEIASVMLGIPSSERKTILSDVVEFTELGDALYRPIKTYSAGMRVRLAFGLVSSLYAEIMLIDEIIGVGDSHFMKKASIRVKKQAEASKILVIASHAESVLRDFCSTGLVLSNGKAVYHGPIDDAISYYNAS